MLPLFAHSRHIVFPPVLVYGFGAIFGKITAIEPLKISRSISDRVDYPPIRLSCFGVSSPVLPGVVPPLNLTAAYRSLWYARFGQGSSISLPKVMALHRRGSISHTGWSFDWNNPSMNYLYHRTFLCPVPYVHKVGIRGKIRNFHDCGKCDIIQLNGRNKTTGKERAPMKGATSIQERLWELRKDKGLNLEELSKLTGISKSALGSYEKEDYKEINHGNLITLADFYGVSVDYLLCRTENREQINTPLTELHLNDEMVALLKSGRINNRLLCELATHKDFIKFLADIEIYVDGIATMQIQNLNALVDTVRHEIIERYRPGEDDPHLKVLQAAHISDDEYFSHMVLDDLNLIIRDIREAHKKDSESAPQTTVADELKENLEAVENFKGSRDEKLVVLYCKQLGINYKNLSDEEFRWLIRILKKSKKMGTPISQRKKR